MTRGPTVLVVGGYGAVGRVVTRALAGRGVPVVVAGRGPARARNLAREHPGLVTLRAVDVETADGTLLDGSDVVVMCVERANARVANLCLTRGVHYVDISATATVLDDLERLDPVARRHDATAVLSVGLAPGLTNVLARRCVDDLRSATGVEVTVLLGLSGDHGPDSARWTVEQLAAPRRSGEGRRARVTLPGFGARTAHPFAFSDQHSLTRTLGVPVTTRVCFDSAAATAALFGLRRAGVFRLGRRLVGTDRLARTASRLPLGGGDRFVVHVAATDDAGSRVAYAVSGRGECHATGVVAAHVVEELLRRNVGSGVRHLDQVIGAGALLDLLPAHGLTVHASA
ncbi:hypothetical protein GCM10009557_55330 [Virgisporangium ochraceum]